MDKDFYLQLLEQWCEEEEPAFLCAYRHVRDIPYGSTGERDPKEIVRNNLGSCSGKHVLLSRLLRSADQECKVVTCLHHFNEALPRRDDYPDELKEILDSRPVIDFHHFIRLKRGGRWLDVDATWDRALAAYGFPVNLGWTGEGDTRVAVRPIKFYNSTEDIIALKIRLISELSPEEQRVRSRFMRLLTSWMAEIRTGSGS